MSVYMRCPREGCDGEVEFSVKSDSDDYRSWSYAEPVSDTCCVVESPDLAVACPGHPLTEAEWESIQEEADKKAAEHWLTWEPAGL